MTSETQPQQAERDRVRRYLVSQAERRDWLELWPRVVAARTELLEALTDVTQEQAEWKPPAEGWSILEVARHLLASSKDVLAVVQRLASGEAAERGTGIGEQPASGPTEIEDVRREFARHSVEFSALPSRLPESPDYSKTAPHMFFGELNCRAWYLFQRVHDLDHLNQIKTNKAAAGYPGREA
jgi:uncharacterized damage-inducible protein DinB